MKSLLAVIRRELVDRRAVFGAAVIASILPLVSPLVPGFVYSSAAETRGAAAWVIALGLTWVLSLFLGAGMIGADLSQGRMGFYFDRPVSSGAIWAGKLLGTLIVVVAAEALVMLPSMLLPGSKEFLGMFAEDPWWFPPVLLFGIPLALIVVSHAAGIIFRARSLWLILDVAALTTLGLVCWASLSPLIGLAPMALAAGLGGFALLAIVAFVIAGAAQVAIGRTDLKRSHAALSTTLWALLAVAAVAVVFYGRWLHSVEPADISVVGDVDSAPSGNWIVVSGESRGRFDLQSSFLLNLETGSRLKIQPSHGYRWWTPPVAFSRDGRWAAWLERSEGASLRLKFAALDGNSPKVTETQMLFKRAPNIWLSPDGSRVAVVESRTLSVADLQNGSLVAAVRLPQSIDRVDLSFCTSDIVNVRGWAKREHWKPSPFIKLFELDLVESDLEATGEINGIETWALAHPDREARRLLVSYREDDHVQWKVLDARSGAQLADLGTTEHRQSGVFLTEGGIARGRSDGNEMILEVFGPDGEVTTAVELGPGSLVWISGELSPRRLVVGVNRSNRATFESDDFQSFLLDVDTAEVTEIPDAEIPFMGRYRWYLGRDVSPAASRLFGRGREALLLWDPETDTMATVVGR